jgi:large subunit ribosomal protein L19
VLLEAFVDQGRIGGRKEIAMTAPVTLIKDIENRFLRAEPLPAFRPGDTVKVWVKIREGQKTRLQAFEGVCIRRTHGGNRAAFTVRKISYGVGVERIFADNSPNIDKVEVLSRGKVRQSRLYYLRNLRGKAARIKERAYDRSEAKSGTRTRRRKRKAAKQAAAAAAE